MAVSLTSITMIGLSYGILQGTQRFAAMAGMLAFEAVGRIGGTVVGLVVFRSATGALAGTAIGAALVAFAGWVVCGRPRPARHHKGHVGEVLHAVQAMLALVLLVNLDLVLARHHLPAHEAGEYAVGAIVTKIAYWLPQAVAILVLPRLASEDGRRRMVPRALAICASLDAVVVLGAAHDGTDHRRDHRRRGLRRTRTSRSGRSRSSGRCSRSCRSCCSPGSRAPTASQRC